MARRRISAASASGAVMPVAASTTKTMTSASRIASRAWSWTRASIGSSGSSSSPPVSTTTNRRPFHSASPYRRSRVVRARSSTIAVRPTDDAVEERALADVRAPDDRDDGDPGPGAGHRQAAPDEIGALVVGQRGRAAGRGRGALERGQGQLVRRRARVSGVPANSRIRSVTSRRSSIGVEVPPVTPTTGASAKTAGSVEVADALDLDGRRPGDLAQAGQLLRVGAGPAADDDHQVHVAGQLHRVFLAPDRDRADGVDDLELVGARDHERRQPLELPGRLGGLADERHPLPARDGRLPLLLLVHDDGVGGEAEQPDDLGVLGRPEQDDRVALLDEAAQLALLLDDPGAGAVDDLEAARVGAFEDVRADAVGADDDRGAVVHVVELLDGLDAQDLEFADDTLVVDDLSEGMGGLAGGRGLLGLVDRFADAVAEAGPPARCGLPGPCSRLRLSHGVRRTLTCRARPFGIARRRRTLRAAGGSRPAIRLHEDRRSRPASRPACRCPAGRGRRA